MSNTKDAGGDAAATASVPQFPYYPLPHPDQIVAAHQNDVIRWAFEFNQQIEALNEWIAARHN